MDPQAPRYGDPDRLRPIASPVEVEMRLRRPIASEREAELRRAMIAANAACLRLVEHLDVDELEQLGLAVRVQEVCDLLSADMSRYAG
ncbi:MAG TPA: hypothetical protein VFA16_19465 [Mycobacterium sp.]|uniref:hypothetical protein n=1 Tax=Mycobacterium sp. TaxID=1785 RepID=UPI002D5FEC6B|nr:hypothetical protein [Mycobacterium sp.]HZU49408.1 hypothetical protein [Mycobacterium sp.]